MFMQRWHLLGIAATAVCGPREEPVRREGSIVALASDQLGGGWVDDGFGHRMIRLVGWTPPGGQSAVSVTYQLPSGTFSGGDTSGDARSLTYRIQAEPQSLFTDSVITVQVTGPDGFEPERQPGMKITEGTATLSAVQSGPVNAEIGFSR